MADKDYYEILGVNKDASAQDLKSAYRRLAKKYHPDLYATASEQEKKNAEEKFKEINHAYDVLSDDQKRAAYDAYGDENGPQGGGFGSGFGGFGDFGGSSGFGFDVDDIFSTIFNGFGGGGGRSQQASSQPQRGQDIILQMRITFEEAAFGVEKTINVKRVENCPDCKGTGAKNGTAYKTCPKCNGTGHVTQVQRTPFGQIQTSGVCPQCHGKGRIVTETCPTCGGKGRQEKQRSIKINIPAGIADGQRITYQGEGHAGANNGPRGNLVIEVQVMPHKLFRRNNYDLQLEIPISICEAALGCTIMVPTLKEPEELRIPEGTQTGTIFKLKNLGIKKLRGLDKGDLYVKVVVETPKNMTRTQRDLLRKLDMEFESKQFPKKKEYRDKL